MASSRLSALLQNNIIVSETTNPSGTLGLPSMPNYNDCLIYKVLIVPPVSRRLATLLQNNNIINEA
jgi:hypothetical protein